MALVIAQERYYDDERSLPSESSYDAPKQVIESELSIPFVSCALLLINAGKTCALALVLSCSWLADKQTLDELLTKHMLIIFASTPPHDTCIFECSVSFRSKTQPRLACMSSPCDASN